MKSENTAGSRRNFLKKSIMVSSLLPFINVNSIAGRATGASADPLKVHIFSKHLQFLNFTDMAEAVAEMGFDGIDLTVRPNGHVLPERVETDLPKAVEAMRKANLSTVMMTTAVEDATSATDKKLLETAAKLGFQYYRMNWFKYPEGKTIPQAIEQFQQRVKDLGMLNKKIGITGCYQNHSGGMAGASLWELWEILRNADPKYMGTQYDIHHAVIEGGLSWKNGLRLIEPYIKLLAVKDFTWVKKNNQWVVEDLPLGEGMVDFKTYFTLLKRYKIQVPVSLHLEYPIGGAENGATQITIDKREVFAAMKRDLRRLQDLWQAA